jgi:dTMP kinase
MARGKFIVIEGIDGAGTTTQAGLLHSYLTGRGIKAKLTCEPSGGPAGLLIRSILSGKAGNIRGRGFDRRALALLFAADRLDHVKSFVEPALAAGEAVVSDRYVLSSYAYQSIDCDPEWVKVINSLAPEPNLYVFLKIPVKAADARLSGRQAREIFEEASFQERVAARYESATAAIPSDRLLVVDGTLPKNEISLVVRAKVSTMLPSAGG